MTLTKKMPGRTRKRPGRAVVAVQAGVDVNLSAAVDGGPLVVGTQQDCSLRLTDPTVSRRHAQIVRTPEGYLLQDLDSTNGTLLDGVRVDSAYLRNGATITIGKTTLVFRLSADSPGGGARRLRFGEMVSDSPQMQEAFILLEKLAAGDMTILLEGETGTGKELAARAVHDASPRSSGPFIVFDCSTVPSDLMESELFGYEKGAFTGAAASRPGAVEAADAGTLFLDEIGELPLPLQPKLLRLLDRREYRRLGARRTLNADIRFIAATNRELKRQVGDGTFRRDLFFRVSAAGVKLPPLRRHPEDIPVMAEHFLDLMAERGGIRPCLAPDTMGMLLKHSWPGNARELKNVLETAAALAEGRTIGPEDLPALSGSEDGGSTGSISGAEARAIGEALSRSKGNKRKAARLLGIAPSTLYSKMKKYGL